MRFSKLQQRILRRTKQKECLKIMSRVIQGTAIFFATTALASSSCKLPVTNAYFTDVISTLNQEEQVALAGPFAMRSAGLFSGFGLTYDSFSGSVQLFFDVHRFEQLAVAFDLNLAEDLLTAQLNIPSGLGFEAEDIINSSIGFFYNGVLLAVQPAAADTQGNTLTLSFVWSEIQALINSEDLMPQFDLVGRGAGAGLSGLGESFIFKGTGQVSGLGVQLPVEVLLELPLAGEEIEKEPGSGAPDGTPDGSTDDQTDGQTGGNTDNQTDDQNDGESGDQTGGNSGNQAGNPTGGEPGGETVGGSDDQTTDQTNSGSGSQLENTGGQSDNGEIEDSLSDNVDPGSSDTAANADDEGGAGGAEGDVDGEPGDSTSGQGTTVEDTGGASVDVGGDSLGVGDSN